MREKWRYISYRSEICGFIMLAVSWVVWLIALVLAIRATSCLPLVVVCGVVILGLSFFVIASVAVPYRKQDKQIRLYLAGYTAAGIKNPEFTLSPATEELFEAMLRIRESDQMRNANKRQAQYLALQTQINPHFLYNTLESIRSEAMEAGIESVMNMTEALASFFRYTISNVENMVTLEEELENIRTYFSIQKYRFEDRIRLTVEYEQGKQDMLQKCLMPKLTLQPVVENGIIHGIERKMGEGTVRIMIRCTKKRLIILVSDDGIGMPPEVLEKLNRQLNQPESDMVREKKGGIALVNVNNRIHLIFGEEYGMSLYSTQGVGTDVTINLPLITSRRQIEMNPTI